jgi:hypothetical protein
MIRRVHGYRFHVHSQPKIPSPIVKCAVCSYFVTIAARKEPENKKPRMSPSGAPIFNHTSRRFAEKYRAYDPRAALCQLSSGRSDRLMRVTT